MVTESDDEGKAPFETSALMLKRESARNRK
jgi:hypothetical protein